MPTTPAPYPTAMLSSNRPDLAELIQSIEALTARATNAGHLFEATTRSHGVLPEAHGSLSESLLKDINLPPTFLTGIALNESDIAQEYKKLFSAALMNVEISSNLAVAMARSAAQQWFEGAEKLVSGAEFARLLNLTEEAIRQRQQAGKLIAILKDGRERGRGFPVFQSWEGIAGAPLESVFGALGYAGPNTGGGADATDVYQFFISKSELLGGLTPVHVLTGIASDVDDLEAAEFLKQPQEARLDVVLRMARAQAQTQTQENVETGGQA